MFFVCIFFRSSVMALTLSSFVSSKQRVEEFPVCKWISGSLLSPVAHDVPFELPFHCASFAFLSCRGRARATLAKFRKHLPTLLAFSPFVPFFFG